MTQLTLGQRIAMRRKLLGLSQEALAEQLAVSRQAVSKWESDATVPEIDKLISLGKLFDVSVGWILGVESEPTAVFSEEQLKTVEELIAKYHTPKKRTVLEDLDCWLCDPGCVAVVGIFRFPQKDC